MSKVDDMTDEEVEKAALQFHKNKAVHLCEHGHPDHALEPGGPCILEHVERYVKLCCAGFGPTRRAITKHFGVKS